MASLEDILNNVSDETRARMKKASDVELVHLETPSIGLTKALNGGFTMGRQVLVWGPKSSGKSTLCLGIIREAQEEGYVCAYVDVEDTFDPDWAERIGVDTDNLLYTREKSIMGVVDVVSDLMRAEIDVVIVDSITAMVPAAYLDDDGNTKPMMETGRLGAIASDMSKGLSLINHNHTEKSLLVLVSQSRMKSSGMYWSESSTGGKSTEFYTTTSIKLWSSNSQANTEEDEVVHGGLTVKKPVARRVKWEVEYNKTSTQGEKGEYLLYHDGPFVGIDNYAEVIDYGARMGVIEKSGSWFSYGDEKLGQGVKNAADTLRDSPELYDEIRREVINE